MAAWVLTPALVALRLAFDRRWPGRDRRSDGGVGDPAHAATSSDHNPDETGAVPIRDADSINEVHAIDVDAGLDPGDPAAMGVVVRRVADLHRRGVEDRLRYIIYDRRIASASWGWVWRPYNGANPHTTHAHFSGSYVTGRERDDSPWSLGGDGMSKAEVLEALDESVPWASTGVRAQAAAAGWAGKISLRAMVEHIWASIQFATPAKLTQVLQAIADDDGNDVVLSGAQVEQLAGLLAERLPAAPSAAAIAEAVNDDASARLAG